MGVKRAIASEVQPRSDADGLSRPVTRRNFIVWYLAGLLTATVVAIVAPILIEEGIASPSEFERARQVYALPVEAANA